MQPNVYVCDAEMMEMVKVHGYERVRHRMGLDVRTVLSAAATWTGEPKFYLHCYHFLVAYLLS